MPINVFIFKFDIIELSFEKIVKRSDFILFEITTRKHLLRLVSESTFTFFNFFLVRGLSSADSLCKGFGPRAGPVVGWLTATY